MGVVSRARKVHRAGSQIRVVVAGRTGHCDAVVAGAAVELNVGHRRPVKRVRNAVDRHLVGRARGERKCVVARRAKHLNVRARLCDQVGQSEVNVCVRPGHPQVMHVAGQRRRVDPFAVGQAVARIQKLHVGRVQLEIDVPARTCKERLGRKQTVACRHHLVPRVARTVAHVVDLGKVDRPPIDKCDRRRQFCAEREMAQSVGRREAHRVRLAGHHVERPLLAGVADHVAAGVDPLCIKVVRRRGSNRHTARCPGREAEVVHVVQPANKPVDRRRVVERAQVVGRADGRTKIVIRHDRVDRRLQVQAQIIQPGRRVVNRVRRAPHHAVDHVLRNAGRPHQIHRLAH